MYDLSKRSSQIGNEVRIIIDEVNPSMSYINGHDKTSRTYRATFDAHDPVLAIPMQGEMWVIVQYQNEWRLSRKFDTTETTAATSLDPGDRRLEATNNLYLNGAMVFINGTEFSSTVAVTITPIYVGTKGLDGVDDFLATNPHPFQVGDIPGPIPFIPPWTNSLNGNPPVSFYKDSSGRVFVTGGFVGGSNDSIIFVFPVGFRPIHQEILLAGSKDGLTIATCTVDIDGTVTYLSAK